MVKISSKGNFKKTNTYLQKLLGVFNISRLDKYGKRGVEALKENTPKDTGVTSESWHYSIIRKKNHSEIIWSNSNYNKNVNIALIIQYGHSNGKGAWVKGVDYINPALTPLFEEIANEVWEEVSLI